jgi:hypothetical protein
MSDELINQIESQKLDIDALSDDFEKFDPDERFHIRFEELTNQLANLEIRFLARVKAREIKD